MDLLDISKDIKFIESSHQYFLDEKELTSVTTVLSKYKAPFDPTGIIAYKCAQREGITKEEIQAKWKKTSEDACDYGRNVHAQIEDYLNTGIIKDTPEKDIIKDFSKIKFKGKIYSELRLKSEKYGLAGTCDLAVLNKNVVTIHDAKTNKRFDIKSRYGNKFLYPLEDLPENHHTIYSLQILIYGEMVKEHGFDFEPGHILWVDPDKRKIQKFDVLDLRKEVKLLLDHYNAMRNW